MPTENPPRKLLVPSPDAPLDVQCSYYAARVKELAHAGRPLTPLAKELGVTRETLLNIACSAPVKRGTLALMREHLQRIAAAQASSPPAALVTADK